MRAYRQIILVAVLTTLLIAAGVGWMRCYLSPLAEEAVGKSEPRDEMSGDLPAACLDELAAMDSNSVAPALTDSMRSSRDPRIAEHGNVLRLRSETDANEEAASHATARMTADGKNRLAGRDEYERGAAGRPIAAVQSVEWDAPTTEPSAQVSSARSAHTATLPVSVEEPVQSQPLDSSKTADVLDLMRRLRSDTDSERTSARRELLRRGFSEVDLELARQLFSPDIEVRKQLAAAVPRLASVDASRWLMWLAADPQPDVRCAAITTLATSGDPALLDRVEAMARRDADSQIQALAGQIRKQRDLATSRGVARPLR